MAGDWQALADHIRAAMEERGWTYADLSKATEGRVKPRTIGYLLTGVPRKTVPGSVYAIEAALGWQTGTARRILEGRTDAGRHVDEAKRIAADVSLDDQIELVEFLVRRIASRQRNAE